ncbi:hypothetical protein EDEG_02321 [Edhazardia aedis USNM 41457]|uniref:Uncharacterized protein n=1 Tax=Edhazardia aedis (strain USNM 41457) TaxID=1003232 RepID=J9D721_EDHAE|nr:hypothetical protein EDEG_02321 [Edhazardia aedis USNM 41457]|eukprot:EJW03334.1 hypothetical protein EDEG_02321 [Edhazardia aedis USNM 41457]
MDNKSSNDIKQDTRKRYKKIKIISIIILSATIAIISSVNFVIVPYTAKKTEKAFLITVEEKIKNDEFKSFGPQFHRFYEYFEEPKKSGKFSLVLKLDNLGPRNNNNNVYQLALREICYKSKNPDKRNIIQLNGRYLVGTKDSKYINICVNLIFKPIEPEEYHQTFSFDNEALENLGIDFKKYFLEKFDNNERIYKKVENIIEYIKKNLKCKSKNKYNQNGTYIFIYAINSKIVLLKASFNKKTKKDSDPERYLYDILEFEIKQKNNSSSNNCEEIDNSANDVGKSVLNNDQVLILEILYLLFHNLLRSPSTTPVCT